MGNQQSFSLFTQRSFSWPSLEFIMSLMCCYRQECFYRDRSRVKWLQDGDRNLSFFHAPVRRRQYQNALSSLSINGVFSDDCLIISDHMIEFYSNIFSSDSSRVDTDFSVVEDVILSLVTDVENAFLISIPSTDDIHDAVFTMDAASAPGPNDWLAQIAARIVSLHQFRFIRDRHIEDCIALASGCVNVLHKKCYGGNLAMKIDIRKAFDTLDWSFLRRVLQAFRFSLIFMDWIDCILRSLRLSVLINGSLEGYFHCSRRVRQGDPLFPLLFGITEDFLSRLLSRMRHVRNLTNIMSAFEVYGNISCQLVNWGESPFFGRSRYSDQVGHYEILCAFIHDLKMAFFFATGIPDYLATLLKARVSDFIYEGKWVIEDSFRVRFPDLCSRIYSVAISLVTNSLVWAHSRDGQAMSVSFSDHVCVLWKTTIHAVVWSVWLSRNQWIFESKTIDFRYALCFVWRAVSDANRLEIDCMRNCVDDLLILHRFDLRGRPARAPVIKSVIWSPPAPGWTKVNTDGAALSSPSTGGCGGIFRNCRAFVKGCFVVPLDHVFAFEAELLATSIASNFAWQNGWHRIWLESDSSYVVQLLSSRSEQVP
ncbi:hypothetical protein Ddye_015245 [Dipteronia dyeriana]|uniref:Reverse transcriptase domain-containing protein n=1 Tax=Dipteronia dyeriana TaxID=168575 RepID=A0AAD9U4H2_9ROSI|nr:hypothetical protein Ddye_015245 [Dipteronia dyeriana]